MTERLLDKFSSVFLGGFSRFFVCAFFFVCCFVLFALFVRCSVVVQRFFAVFGRFGGVWSYFQILWRFLRRLRSFSSQKTPWGPILGQNKNLLTKTKTKNYITKTGKQIKNDNVKK